MVCSDVFILYPLTCLLVRCRLSSLAWPNRLPFILVCRDVDSERHHFAGGGGAHDGLRGHDYRHQIRECHDGDRGYRRRPAKLRRRKNPLYQAGKRQGGELLLNSLNSFSIGQDEAGPRPSSDMTLYFGRQYLAPLVRVDLSATEGKISCKDVAYSTLGAAETVGNIPSTIRIFRGLLHAYLAYDTVVCAAHARRFR